jgi:prolyl oligopeptidase
LDQNKLSEDGTSAIRIASWNKQGTIYAYGQSDKGSDWVTIKFKTSNGEDLKDQITKVRYSGLEWMKVGYLFSFFCINFQAGKF